jgi:prevent-host-death family protein
LNTREGVGVTEARRRFSELVSRAIAGERFLICRRERAVAALVGVGEVERLERAAQAVNRLALGLGQDAEMKTFRLTAERAKDAKCGQKTFLRALGGLGSG